MLRQEQDVEDVTRQTFLNAMETLDRFRGESTFSTWGLRITTHAALNLLRKRRGLNLVSIEETTEGLGRQVLRIAAPVS